jgi:hypothetical protein
VNEAWTVSKITSQRRALSLVALLKSRDLRAEIPAALVRVAAVREQDREQVLAQPNGREDEPFLVQLVRIRRHARRLHAADVGMVGSRDGEAEHIPVHLGAMPEAVAAVGPPEGNARWIAVADREADDFQMFHACRDAGQGFVIRAQHDRYVSGETSPIRRGVRLREVMERQPVMGGMYVNVSRRSKIGLEAPPRRRREASQARLARVEVRSASLTLQPPRNDPRYQEGFDVQVVHLREIDPPDDVNEPIDWLLLTSEPVRSLDEALTVIGWYRRRWLIEEFHKAQKTGCRLEKTQLEDAEAFIRLAAITAVIAVRLLQLRETADEEGAAEARAIDHVDRLWVEVVSRVAGCADPETLTLREFYHAIARKGGWLGRRSDGRPGWQTLWRGWQTIAAYVTGIELMQTAAPRSR